jgi:predicted nucleic acid-binding protein
MSGNSDFVLDTNIILFLLNGDSVIARIIGNKRPHISFITEMELLSYNKLSTTYEARIKSFLSECDVVEMNPVIKATAIKIRKNHRMKLPDSIIAATGAFLNMPLLTADEEFNKLKSLQILQYKKQ